VEYNEDGTITVRSTREWVTSLTDQDGITPALCDVVNGTTDQKTYLLTPSHYWDQAHIHWRNYKTRLYPPSHREARFRDNLPGLPDVIHIQTEIQSNVSFLEQMSTTNVWAQIPVTLQNDQYTSGGNQRSNINQHNQGRPAWPTPSETLESQRSTSASRYSENRDTTEPRSHDGQTTLGTEEDRSTTSTQALTQTSRNTMTIRFQALESMLKSQQKAMDAAGRKTSDRLSTLERQFGRLDELDTKMEAVSMNVEKAIKQMEQTGDAQQQLSEEITKMKHETAFQFAELKGSVITSMETQQKTSETMLDMREQLDKLSGFMLTMAGRIELSLTRPRGNSTPIVETEQETQTRVGKRHQGNKRTPTQESLHIMGLDTEDAGHRSPDQKKSRSATKAQDDVTHRTEDVQRNSQVHNNSMDISFEEANNFLVESPQRRKNLETMFYPLIASQDQTVLVDMEQSQVHNTPDANRTEPTTWLPQSQTQPQKASLNSHYNYATDSAEAFEL
jgi:hypothetical protein